MNQKDNRFSLEAMLKKAAENLGTSPENLKKAAQSGDLSSILDKQSGGQSEQIKKVLSDPKEAQKFLNNPEVQKLINQLGGNNKG